MTTSEQLQSAPSTATDVNTEEAPAFPFERKCPFAPASDYADGGPVRQVSFKGVPAWLVTNYQDVRSVLSDRRSSVRNIPDPSRGDAGDEPIPGFFVAMDPPDQTRLRKMLSRD